MRRRSRPSPDSRRKRPLRAAVGAAVAGLLAATVLGGCTRLPPQSIVSTGDSIPRGFDACTLLSDCTAVSYATGNAPSSDSLYRRLLGVSPRLVGYNNAEVGARAVDLIPQMTAAVWQRADVVTVLVGANDACANTVGEMTPVPQFQNSVSTALRIFFDARPGATVVMSSIPNLYRVWSVAHTVPRARLVWQVGQLCPSMLANPGSTASGDTLRRVLVQLQIDKYNRSLAAVCAQYTGCRWDGGALGRYPFVLSQLSPFDYFHPNPAGHRVLSSLLWQAYQR